ncbi:hypothetical protein OS493_003320 [Desmophyllum pertusum]|uniref:Uncharacterized protein n=1 Tax=Desmophyllum pertusum TaxID=174260 RepID=A0A9X0A6G7_9CNID|nr:hypothetical protein OS493_003320 [Desmophyllum pertusum]
MIQASLSTLRTRTRHDFYYEFGGEDQVMEEFEDNRAFSDDVMRKASALVSGNIPRERRRRKYDPGFVELATLLSDAGSVRIQRNPVALHFQRVQGLLKQQYYITADSNRLLKSAYVGVPCSAVSSSPPSSIDNNALGAQTVLLMESQKYSFLSDDNLATLFVAFCEKSKFINELEGDELQNFRSSLLGLPPSAKQSEAEETVDQ